EHPAPSENSTLSLHDALPISRGRSLHKPRAHGVEIRLLEAAVEQVLLDAAVELVQGAEGQLHLVGLDPKPVAQPLPFLGIGLGIDRKSTRLNSSHSQISYAVF